MSTPSDTSRVHPSAYGCITIPFLLIAIGILAWGGRSNWSNGRLNRGGIGVPGEVIELRHVEGNPTIETSSGSSKSPVVRFTTRDGHVRTMVGHVNRAPAPWDVGDEVEVVYDPNDPGRADLRSEVEGWLFWFLIWCVVAAVPAAIALLPILVDRRARRASA